MSARPDPAAEAQALADEDLADVFAESYGSGAYAEQLWAELVVPSPRHPLAEQDEDGETWADYCDRTADSFPSPYAERLA